MRRKVARKWVLASLLLIVVIGYVGLDMLVHARLVAVKPGWTEQELFAHLSWIQCMMDEKVFGDRTVLVYRGFRSGKSLMGSDLFSIEALDPFEEYESFEVLLNAEGQVEATVYVGETRRVKTMYGDCPGNSLADYIVWREKRAGE